MNFVYSRFAPYSGLFVRYTSKTCFKSKPRVVIHRKKVKDPRKVAIFNEVRSILDSSKYVAVYHYSSLSRSEWDDIRYQLDPNDIKMRVVPCKVTKKAIENTIYANMISLFIGSTALAYSNNEASLPELLSVTKKESKLLLLGGLIDNELLTPNALKNVAALPDKSVLHQELLGILQSSAVALSSLINTPPRQLSYLLDRHVTSNQQ